MAGWVGSQVRGISRDLTVGSSYSVAFGESRARSLRARMDSQQPPETAVSYLLRRDLTTEQRMLICIARHGVETFCCAARARVRGGGGPRKPVSHHPKQGMDSHSSGTLLSLIVRFSARRELPPPAWPSPRTGRSLGRGSPRPGTLRPGWLGLRRTAARCVGGRD